MKVVKAFIILLSTVSLTGCLGHQLQQKEIIKELEALDNSEIIFTSEENTSAFPFPKDFNKYSTKDENNEIPAEMSELLS